MLFYKKNFLIISLITVLTFLSIWLLFVLNKRQASPSGAEHIEGVREVVDRNTKMETLSENQRIPNINLTTPEDNDYLKNLTDSVPRLFFRFSEHQCFECVEHALELISKYKEKIGNNRIIFLSSYTNRNSGKIILQDYDLECPIFNLQAGSTGLPVEKSDSPFFFVSDSSLRAKYVFIPIKEISGYTESYLRNMVNILNDSTRKY